MKLHATNNDLLIKESERLISGSVKIYTCEFTFDESWDGYTVTAVFSTGNRLVNMAIVDGKCEIPYEVLRANARVRIGVFGVDGDRRRPTTYSEWIPVEQGVDVTGGNAQPPAPSVYEQWMNSFSDAAEHAEAAQDAADAARNSEYMAHAYAYGLSALEWDDFEAHVSARTGATAMTKKDHRICVGAEYILEVNGEETVVYGRRDGTETVDGISNAKISAMGVDVLCIYLDGEYDRLRFVNSNDYDVLVSYKAVHIDGIIGAKESSEQAALSESNAEASANSARKSASDASRSKYSAAQSKAEAEYFAKVAHYGQGEGTSFSSSVSAGRTTTKTISIPLEIGRRYTLTTKTTNPDTPETTDEILYIGEGFGGGYGVIIVPVDETHVTIENAYIETLRVTFAPDDDSVFDAHAEALRRAEEAANRAEEAGHQAVEDIREAENRALMTIDDAALMAREEIIKAEEAAATAATSEANAATSEANAAISAAAAAASANQASGFVGSASGYASAASASASIATDAASRAQNAENFVNQAYAAVGEAQQHANAAELARDRAEQASADAVDSATRAEQSAINAATYTDQKITELVNGAPNTLDTIGEIAAALKNNKDIVSVLEASIGEKAKASDLTAHTGNTTVHVTSTEKATWNGKSNFSGNYNDLTNKPTIPTAYTHPSSHPASMITGLATVATSGSYNDLTNKPTIPTTYAGSSSAGGVANSANKLISHGTLTADTVDSFLEQGLKFALLDRNVVGNDGMILCFGFSDAYGAQMWLDDGSGEGGMKIRNHGSTGSWHPWRTVITDKLVDSELSDSSTNPVQNKVVNEALAGKLSTSGGTLTGNLTGKYITGTWLQTTVDNALDSADYDQICVRTNAGWIYSRTKEQLRGDIGAVSKAELEAAIGGAIGGSY